MKLKYYLYISDTKLDVLSPQLHRWDKFKFRLSLGFKEFFLKLALEEDKHKLQKVKKLSKYILKRCEVGTIEEPKSYVKETIKMKWGIVPMDAGDIVLFFHLKENLLFVLGGTPKHLFSKKDIPKIEKQSRSDLFSIMEYFRSFYYHSSDDSTKIKSYSELLMLQAIKYLNKKPEFVEQEIEFLAKILTKTTDNKDKSIKIVVGSPIYIVIV